MIFHILNKYVPAVCLPVLMSLIPFQWLQVSLILRGAPVMGGSPLKAAAARREASVQTLLVLLPLSEVFSHVLLYSAWY